MSQGSEGKAKDLWSKLGQTIRSGAETIVQETKELTRMGKIKVELMSLENERDRKFEDIGRSSHRLYKIGSTFPSELGELFLAVDQVEARIEEKRVEMEKLRVESAEAKERAADKAAEIAAEASEERSFCPQCGARLETGDIYCARCGTRVV